MDSPSVTGRVCSTLRKNATGAAPEVPSHHLVRELGHQRFSPWHHRTDPATRVSGRCDRNATDPRTATLAAPADAAVRAIEATQDVDGLTWAKPTWEAKYAMDQAEAYAGLRAGAVLAAQLGLPALAERATGSADRLKAGFDALWDPATGAYIWAVHADGSHQGMDWTFFYPDAVSQAWAVAYGLAGNVSLGGPTPIQY